MSRSQRIDTLTVEIRDTRLHLAKLEAELQGHLEALSSIDRIPEEILGCIIQSALPRTLDEEGRDQLLNFGLVCEAWRNATLFMHQLWSNIQLTPIHYTTPFSYDKIIRWLKRAGATPTSLHLTGNMSSCLCSTNHSLYGDVSRCRLANPTFARLLRTGLQLDHLKIELPGRRCLNQLLDAMAEITLPGDMIAPWDSLRSLDLRFYELDEYWDDEEHTNPDSPPFFQALQHMPKVTSLQLHLPPSSNFTDDPAGTLGAHLFIPTTVLGGLKSFTISCDWDGPHVFRMMEHATNVEELTVLTGGTRLNYVLDPLEPLMVRRLSKSRLRFPHLRTLRLGGARNVHLLDFIQTPKLVELDLSFTKTQFHEETCNSYPLPVVLRNLRNASHPSEDLQVLRIHNLHIYASELATALDELPSLQHLVLDDIKVDDRYMWQLLIQRHRQPCAPIYKGRRGPLPFLQHLQLFMIPYNYPMDHLKHAICMCRPEDTPLCVVDVIHDPSSLYW